jgi:hypothetical protein
MQKKNFKGKCYGIFRCTRKIWEVAKTFANNFLSGDSTSLLSVCERERERERERGTDLFHVRVQNLAFAVVVMNHLK